MWRSTHKKMCWLLKVIELLGYCIKCRSPSKLDTVKENLLFLTKTFRWSMWVWHIWSNTQQWWCFCIGKPLQERGWLWCMLSGKIHPRLCQCPVQTSCKSRNIDSFLFPVRMPVANRWGAQILTTALQRVWQSWSLTRDRATALISSSASTPSQAWDRVQMLVQRCSPLAMLELSTGGVWIQ